MRISSLRTRIRSLGALPLHEDRILRDWVRNAGHDHGRRRPLDFLPKPVREALPQIDAELDGLARILATHPGEDGSARLLVGLQDGQTVETVLLPRDGVCVSSQVGCAVGCQFCMTGQSGLIRQVTSGEIVAQVVLARRQRPVKKVVFMGMGEPAHNLDNVMEAIELLGVEGNIAHKNLVFSTVGDPRVFERLPAGRVKPALALSLHTTKPALRERLLPRAPRMTPAALVEEGERYARLTGYPIQYQWTLLEGVNDGQDELDALVALLRGRYAVLNMIPYNANEGLPFRRPGWDQAERIAAWLFERGILTKLRDSAGQDVDAGCGQLRARALDGAQPVRLYRSA
ncbi:ribosomal RNA large subunit methyltransferase N [Massilia sp. WF1]|uniref:RNA methyltransferase n=1 Tax=unclassified Massilia TaxID=2609279 RepID=UPI00064A83EA|nr:MULTISPECIES: RNA methyltransferase [unclassified Massilia]ALK97999.1 rRNA methyltransferase [Massilia sp. WG5]KLU38264.1 ribosomal RNA large subunit methyltransferase N [Massilia sp. WF1]